MLECKKTLEMRKKYLEERVLKLDSKLALVKILNIKYIEKLKKIGYMLWMIKQLWVKEVEEWEEENA